MFVYMREWECVCEILCELECFYFQLASIMKRCGGVERLCTTQSSARQLQLD